MWSPIKPFFEHAPNLIHGTNLATLNLTSRCRVQDRRSQSANSFLFDVTAIFIAYWISKIRLATLALEISDKCSIFPATPPEAVLP